MGHNPPHRRPSRRGPAPSRVGTGRPWLTVSLLAVAALLLREARLGGTPGADLPTLVTGVAMADVAVECGSQTGFAGSCDPDSSAPCCSIAGFCGSSRELRPADAEVACCTHTDTLLPTAAYCSPLEGCQPESGLCDASLCPPFGDGWCPGPDAPLTHYGEADSACGDGACGGLETCSTCVDDCGPCQTRGVTRGCVEDNVIALTWDDGPFEATPLLLDILAAHRVNGTFFVVGENAARRWPYLQRAYNEGHFIASHSYTHADFATLDAATVRDELANTDAAIHAATCIRPRVFRPPYGSLTTETQQVVEDLGYRIINWNLDTEDWALAVDLSPDDMLASVRNQVRALAPSGIIHLAHDMLESSIALVPAVIDIAREEGYEFVRVDRCVYGPEPDAAAQASLGWSQGDCDAPTSDGPSADEVFQELLGLVDTTERTQYVTMKAGSTVQAVLDVGLPDTISTNSDFSLSWTLSQAPSAVSDRERAAIVVRGDVAVGLAHGIARSGRYEFRLAVTAPSAVAVPPVHVKLVVWVLLSASPSVAGPTRPEGGFGPPGLCITGQVCHFDVAWTALDEGMVQNLALVIHDAAAEPAWQAAATVVIDLSHGAPIGVDTSARSLLLTWTPPVGTLPAASYTARLDMAFVDSDSSPRVISSDAAPFRVAPDWVFVVSEWSACSHDCGVGSRTRTVACVAASDLVAQDGGRGNAEPPVALPRLDAASVGEEFCLSNGLLRPDDHLPFSCYGASCAAGEAGPGWMVEEWSECSAPCGDAVRVREVTCVVPDPSGDGGVVTAVDDALCTGLDRPDSFQRCGLGPCDTYGWVAGPWGECDASLCGDGVSHAERSVVCRAGSGSGRVVDPTLCGGVEQGEIALARDCGDGVPCPEYIYEAREWGACSEPCGGGTALRTLRCVSVATGLANPMSRCAADGMPPPPPTSRACNVQACVEPVAVPQDVWEECVIIARHGSTCIGEKASYARTCVNAVTGEALAPEACSGDGDLVGTRLRPCDVPDDACNAASCGVGASGSCSGHGICTDAGLCDCDAGYTGWDCEFGTTCGEHTDAIVDAHGECCPTMLDKDGVCCDVPAEAGASVELDLNGRCCVAPAVLDDCGVCQPPGTEPSSVSLDVRGHCCDGELDAAGLCCDKDHRVDACGVCGGVQECPVRVLAHVVVEDAFEAQQWPFIAAELTAAVATALDEPSSAVQVELVRSSGRVLQDGPSISDFDVSIVAMSTQPHGPNPTHEVDWESAVALASDVTPGVSISLTSGPYPVGTCGNGRCEVAEQCTVGDLVSDGSRCCPQDCPFVLEPECPVDDAGRQCGGSEKGVCVGALAINGGVGVCKCHRGRGYSGDACSSCSAGWVDDGTGTCRATVAATQRVDGQQVDGGSSLGGALGEDTSAWKHTFNSWLQDLFGTDYEYGYAVVGLLLGSVCACCCGVAKYNRAVSTMKQRSQRAVEQSRRNRLRAVDSGDDIGDDVEDISHRRNTGGGGGGGTAGPDGHVVRVPVRFKPRDTEGPSGSDRSVPSVRKWAVASGEVDAAASEMRSRGGSFVSSATASRRESQRVSDDEDVDVEDVGDIRRAEPVARKHSKRAVVPVFNGRGGDAADRTPNHKPTLRGISTALRASNTASRRVSGSAGDLMASAQQEHGSDTERYAGARLGGSERLPQHESPARTRSGRTPSGKLWLSLPPSGSKSKSQPRLTGGRSKSARQDVARVVDVGSDRSSDGVTGDDDTEIVVVDDDDDGSGGDESTSVLLHDAAALLAQQKAAGLIRGASAGTSVASDPSTVTYATDTTARSGASGAHAGRRSGASGAHAGRRSGASGAHAGRRVPPQKSDWGQGRRLLSLGAARRAGGSGRLGDGTASSQALALAAAALAHTERRRGGARRAEGRR